MDEGYVKLWRKTTRSDIWELSPLTTRIWIWLLLRAAYQQHTYRGIDFAPGDILTSYDQICQGVAWVENRKIIVPSMKSARWSLKMLSQRQALRQEPRHGGLWVNILHWEEYQAEISATGAGTTAGTGAEQGQDQGRTGATYKKEKKEKKEKNNPPTPQEGASDPVVEVFDFWKQTIKQAANMTLTKDRRRCIHARLQEMKPDVIRTAILAAAVHPWWNGDQDGEWKADIKTICGKGSTVERLAVKATTSGNGKGPTRQFSTEEEAIIMASLEKYETDWEAAHDMTPTDELWVEVMRRGKA